MTAHRPVLVAAAAAAMLAATPAVACKLAEDYRVPTNLELAAEANAIVIGQVVGAAEAARVPGEALSSAIEVRPLVTLKGLTPGGTLVLPGMTLAPAGAWPEPGAPDFAEPHPEARAGACLRRSFPAGATVLFFLRRTDGTWLPAGGPLSRWAEDVAGPAGVGDDPWVQLAMLYAQAAQLAPDERRALLEDQLEALQARIDAEASLPGTGSAAPATLALAADLERTMTAPEFPQIATRPPEPAPAPVPQAADLGALGQGIDALGDRE